jgi:hypothetical protein
MPSLMEVSCGLCQPFQLAGMDEEAEERDLAAQKPDVSGIISNMEAVTETKSILERSKSPALLSIPESSVEKGDSEGEEPQEDQQEPRDEHDDAGNSKEKSTDERKQADPEREGEDKQDELSEDGKAQAVESLVVSITVVKETMSEIVEAEIEKIWEPPKEQEHAEGPQSEQGESEKAEKKQEEPEILEIVAETEEDKTTTAPAPSIVPPPPSEPTSPSVAKTPTAADRSASGKIASPKAVDTKERDFDKNPTGLYSALQRKEWDVALACVQKAPHEAKVWISRKETDGRLRWRLLPLHASVIFMAPIEVVQALLKAYPDGAKAKDDQGMLPLHLSFRMGSPESVVTIILGAFPGSLQSNDRKGRTPLVLAETSNGPNKAAFIRAIKKGLNPEEETVDKKPAEDKQAALEKEVAALQAALAKNQETSQVLVDHISSLETQLNQRTDADQYLSTKLAALDTNWQSEKTPKEVELTYRKEFAKLNLEKKDLETKVSELQDGKDAATQALWEYVKTFEAQKAEQSEHKTNHDDTVSVLEEDCRNLRSDVLLLEQQLNNRALSEKYLAGQVANLASQLLSATDVSGNSVTAFTSRIRSLETERNDLRFSVDKLSKKLYLVAGLMDSMGKEQAKIIEESLVHESKAAFSACVQAQMLEEVKEQAEVVEKAKEERQQIIELLNRHVETLEHATETKTSVLPVVEEQAQQLASTSEHRLKFIEGVTGLKERMAGVLDSVFVELPRELPGDSTMVDQVVETILARFKEDIAKKTAERTKAVERVKEEKKEAERVKEANEAVLEKTPTDEREEGLLETQTDEAQKEPTPSVPSDLKVEEADEKVEAPEKPEVKDVVDEAAPSAQEGGIVLVAEEKKDEN